MQPTRPARKFHRLPLEEATKPIDLGLLEQYRARARRTAPHRAIIAPPRAPTADDEDDTRPTKPRTAVGTSPPPLSEPTLRIYPTLPSRDPRMLVALLIALAAVSAMLAIVFYG